MSRIWVLYLVRNGERDYRSGVRKSAGAVGEPGATAGACKLCPGRLPRDHKVIMDLVDGRFSYGSDSLLAHWQVRVIPNFSPLFRIENILNRRGERIYDTMSAQGAHELVILHPDHGRDMIKMDAEDFFRVLRVVRERYVDLAKDERLGHQIFFANRGLGSDSNSGHPCGQIIAAPYVPEKVHCELQGASEWYSIKERCLFCDIIQDELYLKSSNREHQIICMNKEFVVLAPYFGSHPFEMWILPLDHRSDFKNTNDYELHPLADILYKTLRIIESVLGEIRFSLSLLSQPNKQWGIQRGYWTNIERDWHWRFLLIPRLPRMADGHGDFFLGTGSVVNPVLPEYAAKLLRGETG